MGDALLLLHEDDLELERDLNDAPPWGVRIKRWTVGGRNGGAPPSRSVPPRVYLLLTPALRRWLDAPDHMGTVLAAISHGQQALPPITGLDAGGRHLGAEARTLSLPIDGWLPITSGREVTIQAPAAAPRSGGGTPVESTRSRDASAPSELAAEEVRRAPWEGRILREWRAEGASRGGPGWAPCECRADDLVELRWEDGSVQWLRAEDQPAHLARVLASPGAQGRGGASTLVGMTLERVGVDELIGAVRAWLGPRLAEKIQEKLEGLIRDRAVALTADLVQGLVEVLEDLVAAARHREDDIALPGEPARWLGGGPARSTGRLHVVRGASMDQARGVLEPISDRHDLSGGGPAAQPQELLVMVHGALQPTEHAFSDLLEGRTLPALRARFGPRILAWQHRTWSASPAENARDLVLALEEAGLHLDGQQQPRRLVLVGHERGGLVAELLCVPIAPGAPDPAGTPGPSWAPASLTDTDRQAMEDLRACLDRSGLLVDRLVRVGAPIGGTSLLSDRLDRFVSAILGGLELGAGLTGAAAPVLTGAVRVLRLVMKLLLCFVREPRACPGLAAMVPGAPLLTWLAHAPRQVEEAAHGRLFLVAGQSRLSLAQAWRADLRHNLGLLVARGIFPGDHDCVVDTDHMLGGWPRAAGATHLLRTGRGALNHGAYFRHPLTGPAVMVALISPDDAAASFPGAGPAGSRGALDYGRILLDDGFEQRVPRELSPPPGVPVRGTVILVPGIMGTHLRHPDLVGPHSQQLWVDLGTLLAGFASWLGDAAVRPEALIEGFYGDFARYLADRGYRVRTFPYDWRIAVQDSGRALAPLLDLALKEAGEGPVHVAAHSMGGLVLRWALARAPDDAPGPSRLTRLKERGGRILMAGTPNHGAPQLLRMLLTGEHGVLRALNAIARTTRERDLVDLRAILRQMEGVLDMLPARNGPDESDPAAEPSIAEQAWFQLGFWEAFEGGASAPTGLRPTSDALAAAWRRIRALQDLESDPETRLLLDENGPLLYVAGKGGQTATGLQGTDWIISDPGGGPSHGGRLFGGDGTVPYWSAGTRRRAWFLDEEHDLLFTRRDRFPALIELLETGRTEGLGRWPAVARGEVRSLLVRDAGSANDAPPPDRLALAALLGRQPRSAGPDGSARARGTPRPLVMGVTHGSLHEARFPVVLGLLHGEPLSGAGATLDRLLGGRLQELARSGALPSQAGKHLFVPDPRGEHPGVVTIGLGTPGDLSTQDLGDTLRDAFIQYVVLHNRSHNGLSCLLVGAESGLEPVELVAQIVRAAIEANDRLVRRSGPDQGRAAGSEQFLNEIEIIELFEDRAVAAQVALGRVGTATFGDGAESCQIHVESHLRQVPGGMANHSVALGRGAAAHRMRVVSDMTGQHLEFELMGMRARAEQQRHLADWRTIDDLIQAARASTKDARVADRSVGHVLMHEAVPQAMRGRLSLDLPLQLVLDRRAAGVPWELLRNDLEGRPPCTRFVMTRQLALTTFRPQPTDAWEDRVLILADLEADAPLAGARREANEVASAFERSGWKVESLIGPDHPATEVRTRLTPPLGRALHIAAHGVMVPTPGSPHDVAAIALPGGRDPTTGLPLRRLTAYELSQFDPLPQIVFLNTCHSGRLSASDTGPHVPAFAPDIATALISSGVRGVIVTGWEVDDAAAQLFGRVFWERMLNGDTLGEAALNARAQTWQSWPDLDTFGAYQVYGDAGFRLVGASPWQARVSSRREALDLLARLRREADLPDQERIQRLGELEAELPPAWKHDAELAAAMGWAWTTCVDSASRLRGIAWFQHALTRADGMSSPTLEGMLDAWTLLLWRAITLAERKDPTGPPGASPQPVLALDKPMDLDGGELAPEVLAFLALGKEQSWRPMFLDSDSLWSLDDCVRYVTLVQGLVEVGTRGEKLAWATAVRALLAPTDDEMLRRLSRAAEDFQQASSMPQDNPVPLRVLSAGLRVLLGRHAAPREKDDADPVAAPQIPDYETEARELRRLLDASPRAYWSRMAALDLRLIDLLRGADAGLDRERDSVQLEGEYKDVERRLAPDASTAFRSSRTRHLLWTVDRLVRQLQMAEASAPATAASAEETATDAAPPGTPSTSRPTAPVRGDHVERMLWSVDESSIEQRSLDYPQAGRLSKSAR